MEVILGPTNIKGKNIAAIQESLFMREYRTIDDPVSFADLLNKMLGVSVYDIQLNKDNTIMGALPACVDLKNATVLTQVSFCRDNIKNTIYSTVIADIPQQMIPDVISLYGNHSNVFLPSSPV